MIALMHLVFEASANRLENLLSIKTALYRIIILFTYSVSNVVNGHYREVCIVYLCLEDHTVFFEVLVGRHGVSLNKPGVSNAVINLAGRDSYILHYIVRALIVD